MRWIFLSHDDTDHTGNLELCLEMCPNATLVTSWFATERMSGDVVLPIDRQRWVGDGESFDAGDRRLVAVRPPTWDSPTTRGLYDTKTGVYWSSRRVRHARARPRRPRRRRPRRDARRVVHGVLVDAQPVARGRRPGQVRRLGRPRRRRSTPTVVVGAHGPQLTGSHIDLAIDRMRKLPAAPVAAAARPGHPRPDPGHAAAGLTPAAGAAATGGDAVVPGDAQRPLECGTMAAEAGVKADVLDIRLLGPITAERDGETVSLGGPRQRAVLARLALAPGQVVTVDRLVDDVWAGDPAGDRGQHAAELRLAAAAGPRRRRPPPP